MFHETPLHSRAEAHAKAALHQELQRFGIMSDSRISSLRSQRSEAFEEMKSVVKLALHGKADLRLFGSVVTGLCEDASDIDATVSVDFQLLNFTLTGSHVMISPQSLCGLAVQRIADYVNLHSYLGMAILQLVVAAKVPIVTIRLPSGFVVDLSINNELPLFNTALLKCYAETDERVRILVLCVKRWAKLMSISGAKTGNLSSYGWTMLCIYFLQVCEQPVLPSIQAEAGEVNRRFTCRSTGRQFNVGFAPHRARLLNAHSITDILQAFFVFFSRSFVWGREVVSIRTGARGGIEEYPMLRGRAGLFHVEDPIDVEKNLNCVLDTAGVARLKDAFDGTASKLATASASVLLQHARILTGGHL